MKLKKVTKLLVLVFGIAVLSASVAMAAWPATHPGNGSEGEGGKPAASGTNCKPRIMVVLHGTVATAPGTSPTLPFQLMVTVKSANAHGRAYVNATTPMIVPVSVTSSTGIVRQGKASLSSLLAGDHGVWSLDDHRRRLTRTRRRGPGGMRHGPAPRRSRPVRGRWRAFSRRGAVAAPGLLSGGRGTVLARSARVRDH